MIDTNDSQITRLPELTSGCRVLIERRSSENDGYIYLLLVTVRNARSDIVDLPRELERAEKANRVMAVERGPLRSEGGGGAVREPR
jgi:hypothetical protein